MQQAQAQQVNFHGYSRTYYIIGYAIAWLVLGYFYYRRSHGFMHEFEGTFPSTTDMLIGSALFVSTVIGISTGPNYVTHVTMTTPRRNVSDYDQ